MCPSFPSFLPLCVLPSFPSSLQGKTKAAAREKRKSIDVIASSDVARTKAKEKRREKDKDSLDDDLKKSRS
jgi:hypothetical protein